MLKVFLKKYCSLRVQCYFQNVCKDGKEVWKDVWETRVKHKTCNICRLELNMKYAWLCEYKGNIVHRLCGHFVQNDQLPLRIFGFTKNKWELTEEIEEAPWDLRGPCDILPYIRSPSDEL